MFETRLRCVSMTPFARPVVPEEYGSTTTSSRSTGTCSASGVAGKRGDRRVAVGLTDDVHLFDRRVRDRRRRRLEEHRDRHEACRARVDELVMDFARCVRRVHRGEHTAGQRDGVEDDAVLGTVGRHHRDDLALREPTLQPTAGLTAYRVLELAVGHRPAGGPVDEGRLVRPTRRRVPACTASRPRPEG